MIQKKERIVKSCEAWYIKFSDCHVTSQKVHVNEKTYDSKKKLSTRRANEYLLFRKQHYSKTVEHLFSWSSL